MVYGSAIGTPSAIASSPTFSLLSTRTLTNSMILCVLHAGAYVTMHAKDMPMPQKLAYVKLLLACNKVSQKSFRNVAEVGEARTLLADAVSEVELRLPCHELDIKLHNLLHLPTQIFAQGPLWTNAMWAYENIYGVIMRYLKNRRYAESNILRAVADSEDTWLALFGEVECISDDANTVADNTELHMSKLYWLPDSMYNAEQCIKMVGMVPTRISSLSAANIYGADEYAPCHHLHLFYIHNIEPYADVWQMFLNVWYQNLSAKDKAGMPKKRQGEGVMFTKPKLFRAAYDSFREMKLAPGCLPPGLESHVLKDTAGRCGKVQIGRATFCTCTKPSVLGGEMETQAGSTWVMAKVASDSRSKYIGQLKYIIDHIGPDGVHRKLCCVHGWHQESHMDQHIDMPVFRHDALVLKEGNVWPLDQVAAVNFMVVRHYDYTASNKAAGWIVLHRDPRFVRTAGFDMSCEEEDAEHEEEEEDLE
jgi:hypothetical protein